MLQYGEPILFDQNLESCIMTFESLVVSHLRDSVIDEEKAERGKVSQNLLRAAKRHQGRYLDVDN